MPLFEVAILEKPTPKQKEDGQSDKLVFGPKAIVANNEQDAAISAVMDGGVPAGLDRSRMEVMIRPFA